MNKHIERVQIVNEQGASAEVLLGRGFNCWRWQVRIHGCNVDVLWSPEGFSQGLGRPSGGGNPILFPFAGRLRGTSLEFQGKSYRLEPGDLLGNAIHGLVMDRPWRIVQLEPDAVTGEFQLSVDAPDLLERWPADFQLQVHYALQGTGLAVGVRVLGVDTSLLPFSLGMHPYFRLPLGREGGAEDCVVRVPARRFWRMHAMLPTGEQADLAPQRPFAQGMRFADAQLDDILTGLPSNDAVCQCEVVDPQSQLAVRVEFGPLFPHCVVFTPPHRRAICIEPYTSVPNAWELAAQGVESNPRVLQKDGEFACEVTYRVVELPGRRAASHWRQ